ncbi:hypothetical protein INS49_003158 [Diaporthe citri]|uniref:uncharacterized protein n=1 Tax=Diaporthe citri TaxID=83186 RepID=UPI001C826F59|nr:uncharacterized protein INS49_003158 [Diaporthe citri]KAG6368940.1 hypothetical protein INS49_003158 [Diaporthe citri]
MFLPSLLLAAVLSSIATAQGNVTCNATSSLATTQLPSGDDLMTRLSDAVNITTLGADLVIRNASIFTAAEGASSTARGFAVKNGSFIAVTGNDTELEPFIGSNTVVRDLAGAPVVPGLFDAHIHHFLGGRKIVKEVQFPSSASVDEVLQAIKSYAANMTDATAWITGGSWGSVLLPEISKTGALARLDEASSGHPVLLDDDSHHNAWANTAALKAGGVYTDTSTGVLIEGAVSPVRQAQTAAEPESIDDLKEYSLAAWDLLHSYGVTGIQDASVSQEQLDALVSLDEEDKLQGWVSNCLAMNGGLATPGLNATEFDEHAREVHRDRVRTDFTKLILDGVPPAQTAGFLEAYLPSTEHGCNHHGQVFNTTEEIVDILRLYRTQGRSTKIHSIGDWTVQVAMDAFEILRAEGSTQKYQIAHGQFVTPEDRRRMKLLNVVADVSPFLWYPGIITQSIATVLPEEIASHIQPNRDLLDLGILVAGGSDWSVSAVPNPWEGIGGLVTRQDPTGQFPGTLWEEQAVTVEEAIRIFSINGAKAAGLDDVVGSIEVGKAANFIVVDRNPLTVDTTEIGQTKVLSTTVAGKEVFSQSA